MTTAQTPAAAGTATPVSPTRDAAAPTTAGAELFGVLLGLMAPAACPRGTTAPAPVTAAVAAGNAEEPGAVEAAALVATLPLLASFAPPPGIPSLPARTPDPAPARSPLDPEPAPTTAATAAAGTASPVAALAAPLELPPSFAAVPAPAALPPPVARPPADAAPLAAAAATNAQPLVATAEATAASVEPPPATVAGRAATLPMLSSVTIDPTPAGIDTTSTTDSASPASPTASVEAATRLAARIEGPIATHDGPTSGGVVRSVRVAVHDARWPGQVGHEVRLLVEGGVQSATLRVTPEHLGPVEVRIDLVNDRANVQFVAAQAETRQALADAIPRLRELLAEAGVALGDAGVRQDHGNAQAQTAPRHAAGRAAGAASGDVATAAGSGVVATRVGLVDAYA